MSQTSTTYYLWKWADNDLPGKPTDVFAALMRGELHPTLQVFDARLLLQLLSRTATRGRSRGEEWDWQVEPASSPEQARFVFLACPGFRNLKNSFYRSLLRLGLAVYAEQEAQIVRAFPPKLNRFLLGQNMHRHHYDVTASDLPVLLSQIHPDWSDPFAILEDYRDRFVQCYAHRGKFCLEWRENFTPKNDDNFDQWIASYPDGTTTEEAVHHVEPGRHKTTELLRFGDVLGVFQAFVRGKPRPMKYRWRSIKKELQ